MLVAAGCSSPAKDVCFPSGEPGLYWEMVQWEGPVKLQGDWRRKYRSGALCEHPAEADLVVPLLDSGSAAALGYAEETGIPYETAIIRNHFVGRTFIEPAPSIRNFRVKIKHNPIRGILEGKRVVLVDDSIVRGTSMLKISNLMRVAGAREVHVRISAPPTIRPCHYGIDMPTREELIAANHSVDEIRRAIGDFARGSATSWHRADEGGLADLRAWLGAHPEARLVAVPRAVAAGAYAHLSRRLAVDPKRLIEIP